MFGQLPLAVDVGFFDRFLNVDISVFEWVQNIHNSGIAAILTPLLKIITYLGEAGIIFILCAIGLFLTKKYRKAGVAIAAALLIMEVLNNLIIKDFFSRPRPFNLYDDQKLGVLRDQYQWWADRYSFPNIVSPPKSWSFPSGHSSSAFAAAMAAMLGSKKAKIGVPIFVLAAVMAFSRVYVEVHYFSDIAFGAIVGIIYGILGCVIVDLVWNHTPIGKKIDEIVDKVTGKLIKK